MSSEEAFITLDEEAFIILNDDASVMSSEVETSVMQ